MSETSGGFMEENMLIERAIAIFGMLFWFAFPIGIMISVIQQDRDAHHSESEKTTEHSHSEEMKKTA